MKLCWQDRDVFSALALLVGIFLWQAGSWRSVQAQSPPDGLLQSAPQDTLQASVVVPEGYQPPSAVTVAPDSIVFGGMAYALLEWRPGSNLPAPEEVSFSVEWLAAADPKNSTPVQVAWLSGVEDLRLAVPFRVYQTAPFRLMVGSESSDVIQVRRRTAGTDRLAPIRPPRSWGGGWTSLVLTALIMTLVVLAVWWLIQRRRQGPPDAWTDWDVLTPAWVGAAVELRALLGGDFLARGDGRKFLDGLAAVTRRFVGDNYRIPALEMTGQEIVTACVGLGYEPGQPCQFAQIIDQADRVRYDRCQPDTAFCLAQAGLLCKLMSTARVMPRQTVVPPERLLQAERAWAAIASELVLPVQGAPDPNPTGGA